MVISNNALPAKEKLLLDVTARILSPTFALSGNNSNTPYEFLSFDNETSMKLVENRLNEDLNKFTETVSRFESTSNYVVWNKDHPRSDIILYNKGLNCVMGRKIEIAEGKIKIEVELMSKSIFAGVKDEADIIGAIRKMGGNEVKGIVDSNFVFPEGSIKQLMK